MIPDRPQKFTTRGRSFEKVDESGSGFSSHAAFARREARRMVP
jgi:hypothetical protein